MSDTIFALSSGAPPAAIAVVRISGAAAGQALQSLAGRIPEPRRAHLASLRNGDGSLLDRALVLWFPGPATATGEDLAELHLHGGRAVVAAVESALEAMPELRRAVAGEFTRRAFANGRIDLAEAEGLADLLSAETELQRQNAMALAGGALSRKIEDWRTRLLHSSAAVEAVLDFADEDDVAVLPPEFAHSLSGLRGEIAEWLARPRAEVLKNGFRVVLAGPPNAGKSTLFNALVEDEAAITAPQAGTTRDVLLRAVALEGVPFVFIDTAGLRETTTDSIEAIGIERAYGELDRADLVLWLGQEGRGPKGMGPTGRGASGSWEIAAQSDLHGHSKSEPRHSISAVTGQGMDDLRSDLVATARASMPKPGEAALNQRQSGLLQSAVRALNDAAIAHDPLLVAEDLRIVRTAFDALVGRTGTEDVLDALFGRFCIGK